MTNTEDLDRPLIVLLAAGLLLGILSFVSLSVWLILVWVVWMGVTVWFRRDRLTPIRALLVLLVVSVFVGGWFAARAGKI